MVSASRADREKCAGSIYIFLANVFFFIHPTERLRVGCIETVWLKPRFLRRGTHQTRAIETEHRRVDVIEHVFLGSAVSEQ